MCTYQGSDKIHYPIKAFGKIKTKLNWNVLIVDNGSTNASLSAINEILKQYALSNISVISLKEKGKANAIEFAFKQINSKYIIICDDDNILSENYLDVAWDLMETNNKIGALGGWCDPIFESVPSNWNKENDIILAIGKQAANNGPLENIQDRLYGAGMVLRTSAIHKLLLCGFSFIDRIRGDDTEICYALRLANYEIWYHEKLYFKHFITSDRLTLEYSLKLAKIGGKIKPYEQAYLEVLAYESIKPSRWFFLNKVSKNLVTGKIFLYILMTLKLYLKNQTFTHQYRGLIYYLNEFKQYFTLNFNFQKYILQLVTLNEKLKSYRE